MKILKDIFIFLLFIFLISCSSSKLITKNVIVGKIYSIGNEPFTQLGIEDNNGTLYIIMDSSPVYNEINIYKGKYCKIIYDKSKSNKWDELYVIDINPFKEE